MIINVNELNQLIIPLVQTLSWGAVVMMTSLPVAAAAGIEVAGKLRKK